MLNAVHSSTNYFRAPRSWASIATGPSTRCPPVLALNTILVLFVADLFLKILFYIPLYFPISRIDWALGDKAGIHPLLWFYWTTIKEMTGPIGARGPSVGAIMLASIVVTILLSIFLRRLEQPDQQPPRHFRFLDRTVFWTSICLLLSFVPLIVAVRDNDPSVSEIKEACTAALSKNPTDTWLIREYCYFLVHSGEEVPEFLFEPLPKKLARGIKRELEREIEWLEKHSENDSTEP